MLLTPTLIIGIGTSGTDVVRRFSQKLLQEFGPICFQLGAFQTICIETDTQNTETKVEYFQFQYDANGVPRRGAKIEDTQNSTIILSNVDTKAFQARLEPGRVYNQSDAEWADRSLFASNAYARSASGGTGHRRMISRQRMRSNSNKVLPVINDSLRAIANPENHSQSAQILSEHYNTQVEIDPLNENVVIAATLSGGTGSGAFLELAYQIPTLNGGYEHTTARHIYGMFSIINDAIATERQGEQILCANIYAALSELDFFSRNETRFATTFPDGISVDEQARPFDLETIFMPSNMSGKHLTDTEGRYDKNFSQLHEKMADDLFLRMLVGVNHSIQSELVNVPTKDPRYAKPREV